MMHNDAVALPTHASLMPRFIAHAAHIILQSVAA